MMLSLILFSTVIIYSIFMIKSIIISQLKLFQRTVSSKRTHKNLGILPLRTASSEYNNSAMYATSTPDTEKPTLPFAGAQNRLSLSLSLIPWEQSESMLLCQLQLQSQSGTHWPAVDLTSKQKDHQKRC